MKPVEVLLKKHGHLNEIVGSMITFRKLLQKHGFTNQSLSNVSAAPSDVWLAYNDLTGLIQSAKNNLNKYGLFDDPQFKKNFDDYIFKLLSTIEEQYPLEDGSQE